MDARKAQVLSALIDEYIQSAEPVGSRTLAKRGGFTVSAATLRNELADLEDLGYLDKPHTSAGRVPSDKGYRYYVDRLLIRPTMKPADRRRIQEAYRARIREITWFLHQTARLVADVTHYPTVVMAPPLRDIRLTHLRFVTLSPGRALMVVETDNGLVENRVVSIPAGVETGTLEHIAEALSEELAGAPLSEVASLRLVQLEQRLGQHAQFVEDLLSMVPTGDTEEEHLTVEGVHRLLEYPEFHNVDRMRSVWEALAGDGIMHHLLLDAVESGLQVRIGAELPVALSDMSIVSASYRLGGRTVGRVAVVGPRRMDYGRVMVILEQVSEELTHALNWA